MWQKDLFGEEYDVATIVIPRKSWLHCRDGLLEKYDHICYLCNRKIDKRVCDIDHYIPLARGGEDEWHNLRPTHACCNSVKRDRMPDDPEMLAEAAQASARAVYAFDNRECCACFADISDKGIRAYKCDECIVKNQRQYTDGWHKTLEGKAKQEANRRKYRSNPFNGERKKQKALRSRRNKPRKK